MREMRRILAVEYPEFAKLTRAQPPPAVEAAVRKLLEALQLICLRRVSKGQQTGRRIEELELDWKYVEFVASGAEVEIVNPGKVLHLPLPPAEVLDRSLEMRILKLIGELSSGHTDYLKLVNQCSDAIRERLLLQCGLTRQLNCLKLALSESRARMAAHNLFKGTPDESLDRLQE